MLKGVGNLAEEGSVSVTKRCCAFSTSFAADDSEDEVAAWDAYGPCNSDCDMARFQVRVRR